MRLIFLVLSALVAASWAESFQEPTGFDYHGKVGLKEAERIRNAEIEHFSLQQQSRIVGGSPASLGQHPYKAGLIIDLVGIAGNSVCGSSILTSNRLLTAAHCWFDGVNQAWRFTAVMDSLYLFLGGGTRIASSQCILHPQWTPSIIAQDVAIIYLPSNIMFTNTMHPISLPTGNDIFEDFTGHLAMAAGFGRTSDQHGLTFETFISSVPLQVISVAQCQATFGTIVQINNICTSGAGGVGICGGDSGGPLVANRNGAPTLIGVSSFVAATGCQLGHPSAFARVTSFLNFIFQHL